jgi:hypothetical protein
VGVALESLHGFLKMRRFGYARSESIIAGPPPSPFLKDLL